jgi:flagellar hook protein FlgE
MLAHQQMLDVIANNLANSETDGFKSSRVDFADQLYHADMAAMQPGGTTGGRDPSQTGQGVTTAAISVQFTQGPTQNTGRDLDMMISGSGFFRLQDSTGVEHYSRVGHFGFDGATPRKLVDLNSGMIVLNTQGTEINPVDTIPAVATSEIRMSGNLPPTAEKPLAGSTLTSIFAFRATAPAVSVTGATKLSDTTLALRQPGGPVTVNVFGNAPDGVPYSGAITLPPTATVQDLTNALNGVLTRTVGVTTQPFASVSFDQGALKATGAIPGTDFTLFLGEQAPPAQPATTVAASAWQFGSGADTYAWNRIRFAPASTATTISLYTADGTQHQVAGKWVNTSTTTTGTGLPTDTQRVWDLILDAPAGGSLVPGGDSLKGLTFNADGTLLTEPTGTLQTTWTTGGASSVTFTATGLRGYQGDGFADAEDFTGYPMGKLQSISVDQAGVINGGYSNGKTVPMSATEHQVGIAVFSNPGGLLAEGGNYWRPTVNSGAAVNTIPGDAGTNNITAGAIEGSNVDIAVEFTRLIVAQRGFQSSSKAFQTGDEMLTEAFSLFR